MKKLLFSLAALCALALYAMDERGEKKGLALFATDQTTAPGFVNRYRFMQAPTPSSASTAPSTLVVEEEEEQPLAIQQSRLGSLRANAATHGSWGRVSVSDLYPADTDEDTWDIVTTHDAREARALENAQKILMQAQSLVPASLKSSIKTDIYASENPLADLETARELIWACMTRTAPTFASDYVETLTKNFGPCKQYDPNFDYSKVYAYLAYDNAVAMEEPNETFAHLIKEKLDKAVADKDEKNQWFMRQFGFMFRDPATKQTYDAYLKGGEEALKKLMIPEERNEILQACFDQIAEAKYALKELQKAKK